MPRKPRKAANVTKSRSTSARKAKNPSKPRRHSSAHTKKSRNPRRRPAMTAAAPRRRHKPNPNVITGGFNMLKQGLYALVGLVLTRQLPQLALNTNNTSWMGYAANIATMFLVGMIGHKVLGRDAGNSMMLGGGLYVANRVIGDFFSPLQSYLSLSGMGDPNALSGGRGGRGLRGIVPGYFPLPVPTDAQNMPIIPAEIRAFPAPTPAAMASAAAGGGPVPASVGSGPGRMSGVGAPNGRFGGRF